MAKFKIEMNGMSCMHCVGHVKNAFEDCGKVRGMDVEIIKIEGSVELAPILGLCDAIVDIMETGTTLKENGLIVFDRICDISARVIVNKASFKMKREEIGAFINRLKQVL